MNRKEFFKEMGGSLIKTVRSVYEPFLNDDLNKVEKVADKALGIIWLPLMRVDESCSKLEIKFIEGKPIIVSQFGTNIQARKGICPECSNLIVVSTLYSTGKCLNCGKEYNFQTEQGELKLDSLEVKKKDQMYFVGYVK